MQKMACTSLTKRAQRQCFRRKMSDKVAKSAEGQMSIAQRRLHRTGGARLPHPARTRMTPRRTWRSGASA